MTKKSHHNNNNPLVSMRAFFFHVDWATWWEEFYLTVDEKNKWKFRTVTQFAKAKAKNLEQKRFIEWYIGPYRPEDPYNPYKSWLDTKPVDWIQRRRTGGWCSPEALREFQKEVERKISGLEALREVGNRFTLQTFARAEKLAQRVDSYFRDPLLEDGSFEKNMARFNAYLSCQNAVHDLKKRAVELYAKCHGINVDTIDGLTQVIQAATINQIQAGSQAATSSQRAITGMVEMILRKHKEYQLPLPEGAEEVILDVTAEDETPARKKEKLN